MQHLFLDFGCFAIHHVCECAMCMNVDTIVPQCTCGAQRTTWLLVVPFHSLSLLLFSEGYTMVDDLRILLHLPVSLHRSIRTVDMCYFTQLYTH